MIKIYWHVDKRNEHIGFLQFLHSRLEHMSELFFLFHEAFGPFGQNVTSIAFFWTSWLYVLTWQFMYFVFMNFVNAQWNLVRWCYEHVHNSCYHSNIVLVYVDFVYICVLRFFRLFPSVFYMLTTFLWKTLFSENVVFLWCQHVVLITIVFTQPSSLFAIYCQIVILLWGRFSNVDGFYVSC
jgi:hypothetical protein